MRMLLSLPQRNNCLGARSFLKKGCSQRCDLCRFLSFGVTHRDVEQALQSKKLSIADAFGAIPDPRVAGQSKHDLVEMRVLVVCAMVCGLDDFVGIEAWGNERIDWLRRFLKLENGIPSHDALGRLFGLLDRKAVEKSLCNWLIGAERTINGRTSRERRLYQQHRPR